MNSAGRLQALTSLRFFAALAIVLHHTQGHLGLEAGFASPFLLEQGVSFFFVLSGFILSHVHGRLTPARSTRFLWARFARVWPGHIAATILVVSLFGWSSSSAPGLTPQAVAANIALLHAWFPWPSFYYSLNNVSWTLSVEAFFYVTFPLITQRIDRRWPFWLAFSLAAGVAMTALGDRFESPAAGADAATMDSFVYIHPVARWFEFVLGVCTAVAWRWIQPRLQLRRGAGTALETLALALALSAAYFSVPLSGALSQSTAQFLWLAHGPIAAPAFAVLIVVMALERGEVSRLLARPLPVRLGEISYSVYLVHYVFLRLAWTKFPDAAAGPGLLLLLAQILLAAHLLWQCVELPARRRLASVFPMEPGTTSSSGVPAGGSRTLAYTLLAHTLVLGLLFAGQIFLESR